MPYRVSYIYSGRQTLIADFADGQHEQAQRAAARLRSLGRRATVTAFVHLQGIGNVAGARRAEDLLPGMTVIWDHGHTSEVLSVEEVGRTRVRVTFEPFDPPGHHGPGKKTVARTRLFAVAPQD